MATSEKNFIRLVDDDKIPETHKRLNHHYLRRLPYYAILEPPIIVEAPEPEPLGALIIKKDKHYGQWGQLGIIAGRIDYYERDARKQLNNYTDSVDTLRAIITRDKLDDFLRLGVLKIMR